MNERIYKEKKSCQSDLWGWEAPDEQRQKQRRQEDGKGGTCAFVYVYRSSSHAVLESTTAVLEFNQ